MSDQTDTLASVAAELAKILEPLRTELVAPRTQGFFAQMGIPLTDAQATALVGPAHHDRNEHRRTDRADTRDHHAIEAEDWGDGSQKASWPPSRSGKSVARSMRSPPLRRAWRCPMPS